MGRPLRAQELWLHLAAAVTAAPRGTYADRLAQYEQAKGVWTAEHPRATPAEYEAAMHFLATRYRI